MCHACGAFMGVADECPYCGASASSIRLTKPSGPWATQALIGLNLFFFGLAIALGGVGESGGWDFLRPQSETLFALGAQWNPAVSAGDWWRLVMAVFLHGGALHLLFNSWITWSAGQRLEPSEGTLPFLGAYLLSGVGAFVVCWAMDPQGALFTIGASGGVSGLLGFGLVRRWRIDGHFRDPFSRWIIELVVINAIFGLSMSNVNNTAHLAGYLIGAATAWPLPTVRPSNLWRKALAGVGLALVVVSLGAAGQMVVAAERGSGDDVLATTACWRQIEGLTNQAEVSSERVEEAVRCLARAPKLEPAAERVQRDGVRRLHDVLRREATSGVQWAEASRDLRDLTSRFVKWRQEALPRYGLSSRP